MTTEGSVAQPRTEEEYRQWWREQRPNVPYGLCWCGCGGKTKLSPYNDRPRNYFRDQPRMFLAGHQRGARKDYQGRTVNTGQICECGCGQELPSVVSSRNNKNRIRRFIPGHNKSRRNPEIKYGDQNYRVEDRGYRTPCWIWQGRLDKDKYGWLYLLNQNSVKKEQYRAHIYHYEKKYGKIAEGLVTDHLCGNPSCVNPDHIEPVTQAENVRRGNWAKITMEDAREIRRLLRETSMSQRQIGEMFGLPQASISDIKLNKTWKE